jgi:hypothetical protein
MATKKSTATENNPKNPEIPKTSGESIQVLQEATCPTTTGKSTLGYQIGTDDAGEIHLKVTRNSGGGYFSEEWVPFPTIQAVLEGWPAEKPITSQALRVLYRGKSANNPGFLSAVLLAEGLLEPVPGKARVLQACDPGPFLARVAKLRGSSIEATAKPKGKAMVNAKVTAKPKTPPKSRANAPRKKSPPRTKRT